MFLKTELGGLDLEGILTEYFQYTAGEFNLVKNEKLQKHIRSKDFKLRCYYFEVHVRISSQMYFLHKGFSSFRFKTKVFENLLDNYY